MILKTVSMFLVLASSAAPLMRFISIFPALCTSNLVLLRNTPTPPGPPHPPKKRNHKSSKIYFYALSSSSLRKFTEVLLTQYITKVNTGNSWCTIKAKSKLWFWLVFFKQFVWTSVTGLSFKDQTVWMYKFIFTRSFLVGVDVGCKNLHLHLYLDLYFYLLSKVYDCSNM